MAFFGKKKDDMMRDFVPELPMLPELPRLPDLPREGTQMDPNIIHDTHELPQLPSFPNSSTGNRFSQHAIRDAIYGEEEPKDFRGFPRMPEEDETPEIFSPRMKRNVEVPPAFQEAAISVKEHDPIFIRIDKFEESVRLFESIKEKTLEIESMLRDTKKIKEEEERETETWEKEIQEIRKKIEKIDREIFSKIDDGIL